MTNPPTPTASSHQFFSFYHAGIIVVAVVGIMMSILQQINPQVVQQQRWLAVPEFVIGLFSFVMFICTIVAFVVWKKRRYAAYTYLTPAVYLGLSVVMLILGGVWSVMMMSNIAAEVGTNPDPLAFQQLMLEQQIPAWLYLSSYLTAAITLAVTIGVWLKFKRTT